ncbi:DUF7716 domain-containing protein, partial [Pseudomonas syringae]
SNANEQLPQPSVENYFDALKFYYENDAFKTFKT